ncbi:hypothetical protein CAC42_1133 [Sphaceloma murrayae]|uniref:Phosphoribosyltransferase domain-containing protein n=1 Tax=Sphaceloma murrayae TaxID=2082308 RepID=A0A2K1R236_9PEZI|nr:hypothetical protein CAC42_1133 [Sphaceloma murrayae]
MALPGAGKSTLLKQLQSRFDLGGFLFFEGSEVLDGTVPGGLAAFKRMRPPIVPLMRGGEPMALGVSETFPLARSLHAKVPEDIKRDHLKACFNLVIVDSVMNTGESVVEFIEHVRAMHATVRIVVIAGCAEEQAR